MECTEKLNDTVDEILSSTLDGQRYLCHRRSHPQETAILVVKVMELVSQHEMSVSVAKGFFDYMKIAVERHSCIKG